MYSLLLPVLLRGYHYLELPSFLVHFLRFCKPVVFRQLPLLCYQLPLVPFLPQVLYRQVTSFLGILMYLLLFLFTPSSSLSFSSQSTDTSSATLGGGPIAGIVIAVLVFCGGCGVFGWFVLGPVYRRWNAQIRDDVSRGRRSQAYMEDFRDAELI